MISSIIMELKTAIHSKAILAVMAVFILISFLITGNSYMNAGKNIVNFSESFYQVVTEAEQNHAEIDSSVYFSYESVITDLYKSFHPSMSINNYSAVFLGFGLLALPILSALFVGMEYNKNRVIRVKITYSSLINIMMSKIIVINILILFSQVVILSFGSLLSNFLWTYDIEPGINSFAVLFREFTGTEIDLVMEVPHNFQMCLISYVVTAFSSIFIAMIVMLTKSNIVGIISTFVMNYVQVPYNFTAQNIFNDIIMKFLYQNQQSLFQYRTLTPSINTQIEILLIIIYSMFVFLVIYIGSKIQRN